MHVLAQTIRNSLHERSEGGQGTTHQWYWHLPILQTSPHLITSPCICKEALGVDDLSFYCVITHTLPQLWNVWVSFQKLYIKLKMDFSLQYSTYSKNEPDPDTVFNDMENPTAK